MQILERFVFLLPKDCPGLLEGDSSSGLWDKTTVPMTEMSPYHEVFFFADPFWFVLQPTLIINDSRTINYQECPAQNVSVYDYTVEFKHTIVISSNK